LESRYSIPISYNRTPLRVSPVIKATFAMVHMVQLLLVVNVAVCVSAAAQPVMPLDMATREQELTSLLQARLRAYQGSKRSAGNVRVNLLEKGSSRHQDAKPAVPSTTPQDLNVPANADAISHAYWTSAEKILAVAGMSTPIPSGAYVNRQPTSPKPKTWGEILQEPLQPLSTKLGAEVMYRMSPKATQTPPPSEAAIAAQFVAQCPMVLFEKNLSIRAPSCNDTLGKWWDPNPLNPRSVVRWRHLPPAGLFFGVDSAMTGPGSAMFAEITERMTLTGSHFVMKNCLGVERWRIEENVYKVDSMGKVSSTIDFHDITMNTAAYFIKYLVKSATGVVVAESQLFRMLSNQVNFTKVVDGQSTGELLAVMTRQGQWTTTGWTQCMKADSPRGWSVYFPEGNLSSNEADFRAGVTTVQDIRVALAGAINLMAYRNEKRGKDGLNTQGGKWQLYTFIGAIALAVIACIMMLNFIMVWRQSGVKDKIKSILFDMQGLMPSRPHQERVPPLHPAY